MKNTIIIAITALFCTLFSCKENATQKSNEHEIAAAAIADSVKSVERLKMHLEHFDSLNEKRAALLIRQKLGSALRNKSVFDAAITVHEQCIATATELQDTLQLIIALNNQGTNFRRIGDLEEASIYHYHALELCDNTMGDTSFIARKNRVRTLNGLGNVMLSLRNTEVAEEMFRRALQGEKELNSATGQAINYANIGAIKEMEGDIDSARIYYNLSMEKNVEGNNRLGISLCHQNLGDLDEKSGNLASARENYIKSYNIGVQNKDVWHWLNSCISLAGLYLKEGNIKEAERYNSEALDAAVKIKAKSRLANLYLQQAKIYESSGKYEKALHSTQKANIYKDSIESEENRVYMQNLRVKYEVNKRKKEVDEALALAQYEKHMRNLILWSSILAILLILVAVAAFIRAAMERKRANSLLEKSNRERQDFYRGITHQLRTPLTIILGMTHELSRFIPADNKVAQESFGAVTRKSHELLDLVTEMIRYNKGEQGEPIVSELRTGDSEVSVKNSPIINNEIEDNENYILVAEDDHDMALLITQMLKNQGYRYHWAQNGQEAYQFVERNLPRLIITDIMMPQMDGLELIKAIRANEKTNHIPIIVVSARTENDDRLAGFNAGAEVYLGKPFIPDELLLMVRKLLEQRELLKKKYSQQIEEADKTDYSEIIKRVNKSEQEFIKQINEYISENIMDCNLNAAMLANHLIMSISTLNRKINGITGTNTTNYIRQRKLARAKYLLKNSDMSMGEIQAVCGFETPSYFSRTFKAEFNITPTEYRRSK